MGVQAILEPDFQEEFQESRESRFPEAHRQIPVGRSSISSLDSPSR